MKQPHLLTRLGTCINLTSHYTTAIGEYITISNTKDITLPERDEEMTLLIFEFV